MTSPGTFRALVELVARVLGSDPAAVTADANVLDDLGADSLDVLEMAVAVEERFGVSLSDAEAEKIETVGDLCDSIVRQLSLRAS